MKKLTSTLLVLVFLFSFAACSNNSNDNLNTSNNSKSTPTDISQLVNETSDNNTNTMKNNKTLVVYYSATGSTEAVAKTISDIVKADVFEIIPVESYTSNDLNWTDESSRVSIEHNDESKRDIPLVKTTPDNWSDYDTVFIGYPIWWAIAAWPVDNFVESNDFSGKTVIPFCTSSSSGIGQSSELLAKMAGTGNWQDGKRFPSSTSSNEVKSWLNDLDFK